MTLKEFLMLNEETASEFAGRAGISQPYVSRLVRRKRFPRHDIIERIQKATDGKVTADDLMPCPEPKPKRRRVETEAVPA